MSGERGQTLTGGLKYRLGEKNCCLCAVSLHESSKLQLVQEGGVVACEWGEKGRGHDRQRMHDGMTGGRQSYWPLPGSEEKDEGVELQKNTKRSRPL